MTKMYFLKKADGFFCQSQSEMNLMINAHDFPKSKIHYFKNPLDLENFYPIQKEECAEKLGFDKFNKYILYIGRFTEPKGIHHLIRIFPKLVEIEPRLRLIIIGWGPYSEKLKEFSRKH